MTVTHDGGQPLSLLPWLKQIPQVRGNLVQLHIGYLHISSRNAFQRNKPLDCRDSPVGCIGISRNSRHVLDAGILDKVIGKSIDDL
jgi:hypothetical protein